MEQYKKNTVVVTNKKTKWKEFNTTGIVYQPMNDTVVVQFGRGDMINMLREDLDIIGYFIER